MVTGGEDLADVRSLFREYADSVGTDLCFQGFQQELTGLPGDYTAPDGTLLLCVVDGQPAGCIGVRRFENDTCEMKRLYVRPAFQGRGCGRFLAERALDWAITHGYVRMVLDTLPSMATAQRMYEQLGFTDIPPYKLNPVPGARYMARPLAAPPGRRTSGSPL